MAEGVFGFNETGMRRAVTSIRKTESMPLPAATGFSPTISSGTSQNWLFCKNNAGETIPRYSLVELQQGTTIDGVYHRYAKKPSTTLGKLYGFSAGLDVGSSDRVGVMLESGLVQYDPAAGTPVDGECWGIKPGQFTLYKNYPGFICLGVEDSTNHIMRAQWEPINRLTGKASSDVSALSGSTPGSGTLTIWIGGASGSWSASTLTVPVLNFSQQVGTAGKFLTAIKVQGTWQLIFESCGT